MVVLVVDDFGIRADEPEGDAPVAADPDGPGTFSFALERMEAKPGEAHVFSLRRRVEATQYQAQSFGMRRLDPGLGPGLEEPGQALVLEAPDHEA